MFGRTTYDSQHFATPGLADVNARDYNGRSPLFNACVSSSLNVIKYLIHHGADVNMRDAHGKTPLDFARARGSPEVVSYMEALALIMASTMISPEQQVRRQEYEERYSTRSIARSEDDAGASTKLAGRVGLFGNVTC